jgi:hypothetical protein
VVTGLLAVPTLEGDSGRLDWGLGVLRGRLKNGELCAVDCALRLEEIGGLAKSEDNSEKVGETFNKRGGKLVFFIV